MGDFSSCIGTDFLAAFFSSLIRMRKNSVSGHSGRVFQEKSSFVASDVCGTWIIKPLEKTTSILEFFQDGLCSWTSEWARDEGGFISLAGKYERSTSDETDEHFRITFSKRDNNKGEGARVWKPCNVVWTGKVEFTESVQRLQMKHVEGDTGHGQKWNGPPAYASICSLKRGNEVREKHVRRASVIFALDD